MRVRVGVGVRVRACLLGGLAEVLQDEVVGVRVGVRVRVRVRVTFSVASLNWSSARMRLLAWRPDFGIGIGNLVPRTLVERTRAGALAWVG